MQKKKIKNLPFFNVTIFSNAFQVHSSTFEIRTSGDNFTVEVPVDSTLENGTVFNFTWSVQTLSSTTITLVSPSNCTYSTDSAHPDLCPDSVGPVINNDFNLIKFVIPGIAEVCNVYYVHLQYIVLCTIHRSMYKAVVVEKLFLVEAGAQKLNHFHVCLSVLVIETTGYGDQ